MEWLKTQEWGLMILDEVHTIPGKEVEADCLFIQIKADPLGVAGDCCIFYLLTSKALTYSQSLMGWHWEGGVPSP